MSCSAENSEKRFVEQILIFDQLWEKDRGVVITDNRANDRWQCAVLDLLSLWWCFTNTRDDRVPVLYMSRQNNDGLMDHRESWATCCPAVKSHFGELLKHPTYQFRKPKASGGATATKWDQLTDPKHGISDAQVSLCVERGETVHWHFYTWNVIGMKQ